MQVEEKVHHLNVFLIKPAHTTADQIINKQHSEPPIEVKIAGHGSGKLFIKRTPEMPPRWADLFAECVDVNILKVPGVSAAFLVEVNCRCFVLAFGHSGRFLIKDDVYEERFGLLCALNSVDPKSFRCVDIQSLDAIQSHTRIQSGQETTPDQFGMEVEQDMLKAIVGAPLNKALGNRMTGSDSLSVAVRMNLSDLPFLLDEYRKKFEADLSAQDYQWVNNISITKSAAIIADLESELNAKLAGRTFDNMWLSIPEIIEWTTVKGFRYTHGKGEVHPDINLHGFLTTVNAGTVNLPRKSRHLDLTREEVSDAESRAEEN